MLSTATDTTELLGCFEQNEPSRLQEATLHACRDLADEITQGLLSLGSASSETEASGGDGGPAQGVRRAECLRLCDEIRRRWDALPLAAPNPNPNPNPDPDPDPNPNPNPDPNPNQACTLS